MGEKSLRVNIWKNTWKDISHTVIMPLHAGKGVRLGRDKDSQHGRAIVEFILF